MASDLRNVRLGTAIIAAAVVALIFLPSIASTNNNNALLQFKSVFAQVEEEGEEEIAFLPYEHLPTGIYIEYPSNWIASTSGLLDYTEIIAFYSPLQNVSDSFPARLIISVIPYSHNIPLQEYTNFVWTILNQSEQELEVRNSSEVTVGGHPGHRVVLANQPLQNSTLILYQMNSWTTVGNYVYLLRYEGEESTFNEHLPEVSRMLESLTIEEVI